MKFKNDVEIQNSDLTISNTGSAHLILNGDSNNVGDAGQEDAIIDFLGDAGDYGYRLNSENYSQKSAFNIQENRNGTYTSRLYIDKDGDVGIGTTNPQAKLNVVAGNTVRTWAPTSGTSAIFESSNSSRAFVSIVGVSQSELLFGDALSQTSGRVRFDHSDNKLSLWASGNQDVTVDNAGKVGIGTDSPGTKLTVSDSTNPIIRIDNTKVGSWVEGEELGSLEFYGNDASGIGPGVKGSVSMLSSGVYGDYFDMAFSVAYSANTYEAMRLTAEGNVGIGTDNPPHELTVQGSASPNIELKNTNYSNGGFVLNRSNYGQQWKWWAQSGLMYFGYSTDEINYANHLTIKANGDIGIGTVDPQDKLEVQGSIYATPIIYSSSQDAYALRMGANNNTAFDMGIKIKSTSAGSPYMSLRSHNTEDLLVLKSGDVGIGTDSPGEKLEVNGNVKATKYINQRVSWNTSFTHSINNVTYFYYIPTNNTQERDTNFYFNNWIAQYGGRVKKVIMRNTGSSTVPTATTIAYKVTVNGTTVFTSGYVSITGTGNDKKSSYTFTDTDATFNEGDRVQVSFNTNGNLYYTAVGISLEYTE